MSDTETARLAMPLLAPGQAQKEMTHNEALVRLDLLVGGMVESADLATPPSDPAPGQCWIVAAGATGAWASKGGTVAGWTAGGWRFVQPPAGLRLWVADREGEARFDGAAWQFGVLAGEALILGGEPILDSILPSIAAPAAGATIDAEARAAIEALISALQHHKLTA